MEGFFSSLSVSSWISLGIWLVALVAAVQFGHSFRKRKRDLVGSRKYFYMFSGVVLVFALSGLFVKGLNYGLDFTGGSVIEMTSEQQLTLEPTDIKSAIEQQFPKFDVLVQLSKDMHENAESGKMEQKVNIRVRDGEGEVSLRDEQVTALVDCVNKRVGHDLNVVASTHIGPTISGELKRGAVVATIITLFFQLLYITFRFGSQLRYGVSADIALLHDVIIMIGFYAWAGLPVDSSFVAAVLTITGYSVMDSVVIFDRIREHVRRDDGKAYPVVVNDAINETMTRSINTSLTTVVVCVALYFFGGVTLQGFAYALLVGVVAGAYSSIFVASPLLVELDVVAQRRDAHREDSMRAAAEARAEAAANATPSSRSIPSRSASAKEQAPASRPATRSEAPSGRSRRRVKGMRRS